MKKPPVIYPDFEAYLLRDGVNPATAIQYQRTIARWAKSGLSAADWLAHVQEESRKRPGAGGLPTTSVRVYRNTLVAFWRFRGWDPATVPPLPPVRRRAQIRPGVALTHVEEARVLDHLAALRAAGKGDPYGPLIFLLWGSGLRIAEACNLLLSDVEVIPGVGPTIRVRRGKTAASVDTVPIRKRAIAELVAWIERRPEGSVYLFPSPVIRDAPITDRAVRDHLYVIGRDAQTQHLNPHIFRHTLATRLAEAGVGMTEIGRVLRHKDRAAGVTARYVHRGVEVAAAAIARLPGE